jgi:hypothetical protein
MQSVAVVIGFRVELPQRGLFFRATSRKKRRYYNPALSNTAGTGQWTAGNPFNNVQLGTYWSSTTWIHSTGGAWAMNMISGSVDVKDKDDQYYIWPVRAGQ